MGEDCFEIFFCQLRGSTAAQIYRFYILAFQIGFQIKSNVMLLITGIMIGYIASSAIALLNFFATAEGVQSYMIWGLGNFGGVSLQPVSYTHLDVYKRQALSSC